MDNTQLLKDLRNLGDGCVIRDPAGLTKRVTRIEIPAQYFRKATALLKDHKFRLLTMAGVDERQVNGHLAVYALFCPPTGDVIHEVRIMLDPGHPVYPSITLVFPSAHWLEREIRDMLGITPLSHPDPRRLAVHPDWPEDVFPLRKDFLPGTNVPRIDGAMTFCPVEGDGIYQIPVGPVHAGIIEPGHFRFFAFGEDVINLQAQLFYTHRGIEKTAEGKHFNDALRVAERVCAACSASHAVAYAQAIESMAGVVAPKRALYIRTILLEMERLYNHVGDIGNMCAGIGYSFGISRGAVLKEQLMRMNMELTGHRYLRGTVVPGGVNTDLDNIQDIRSRLTLLERELEQLAFVILSSQSLLDRMQTTGILPLETALTLGAVGPAARASGVDRDLRRDLPYAAYNEFSFQIPIQKNGDVLCRLKQRLDECGQSFGLLQQAFDGLIPGDLTVAIPSVAPYQTGVGYTESARGANVHWVMSGPDNTVYRYAVRSASHCNWPVVPLCVPGNIVPDFPLINKSFELCYACLDR